MHGNGLVDSLAHLHDPRITDLSGLLQRAAGAGIHDIVSACVDPRQPAPAWPSTSVRLWRAIGLHPHAIDPTAWRGPLDVLTRDAPGPDVVAVGEIGLDARPTMPEARLQEQVFIEQLGIAAGLGLPVIVHCVRRFGRLLELVSAQGPLPHGGVLHGFSGPAELVPRFVALNFSFSFGALVTRPNAARCRAAAQAVPDDRLLVESDAPDRPPEGVSARCGEPAHLPKILSVLADLRGIDAATLGARTAAVARRLYNLRSTGENQA